MLLIIRYTSRQHLQIKYLVPITLNTKSELYVLSINFSATPLNDSNNLSSDYSKSFSPPLTVTLSTATKTLILVYKHKQLFLSFQVLLSLTWLPGISLTALPALFALPLKLAFFHLAGVCSLYRTTSFCSLNPFSRVLLCWGVIRDKYTKDSEMRNYRKGVQHHLLYKLSKKLVLEAIKHLPV